MVILFPIKQPFAQIAVIHPREAVSVVCIIKAIIIVIAVAVWQMKIQLNMSEWIKVFVQR